MMHESSISKKLFLRVNNRNIFFQDIVVPLKKFIVQANGFFFENSNKQLCGDLVKFQCIN